MGSFVLIPGAGGVAWYWHRVMPLLEEAGHYAIAIDLPGDDENAGLTTYADRVVEAIGDRRVILVAQSLGALTAAMVCEMVGVELLVFVNAMIPVRGETAGAWWDNTGSIAARFGLSTAGEASAWVRFACRSPDFRVLPLWHKVRSRRIFPEEVGHVIQA